MDSLDFFDVYHVPRLCVKCRGVMVYKGVGEYRCEDCDHLDYDDYGKVRLFIEQHRGATTVEIEAYTGVSQRIIRKLLRDGRLEIAENSKMFLRCERCGKNIRSGQYCPECETAIHRGMEEKQREMLRKEYQGYGRGPREGEGQKRFVRDK